MGKILYIRLDSSPLPEPSDEIIIKDFNLESYFCTLLGKRLLEDASITQLVSFPGKIVTDLKDFSPETYRVIIEQWENILVQLLSTDDIKGQRFEFNIPIIYLDWLSHHEIPIYREIGKKQSLRLFFKSELFYEELIVHILMKRLRFTLSKITDDIDFITVSFSILKRSTTLINYIMQLNDNFHGLDIIDRQIFIDTYVAQKKLAEKREALKTMYEISIPREGRIRIRDKKTKKYGFINEQMEKIIPCEYDFCTHFLDGFAFVYRMNEIACLIDKKGDIHNLPENQKDPRRFKEDFSVVYNSEKGYGFVNKMGDEVIPCQFDFARNFSDGLACVELNNRYGFIDKTGKIIIPCIYKGAFDFSEGFAYVMNSNGDSGYINKTGKMVIKGEGYDFSEGLAAIIKVSGTEFIDKSGNVVFSTPFRCRSFSDGLAAAMYDDKVGYIDKTGKLVIPFKYDDDHDFWRMERISCDFSDGVALVADEWLGPKYFINKRGEIVVPPGKYRNCDMRPFHDGLACVNGGYIDNKGNEIIPTGILYNQSSDFSEGMVWIQFMVRGKLKHLLIKKEWII